MSRELYPCPCHQGTKCIMDEPCLGCETYATWNTRPASVVKKDKPYKYDKDEDALDLVSMHAGPYGNFILGFNAARELKEDTCK